MRNHKKVVSRVSNSKYVIFIIIGKLYITFCAILWKRSRYLVTSKILQKRNNPHLLGVFLEMLLSLGQVNKIGFHYNIKTQAALTSVSTSVGRTPWLVCDRMIACGLSLSMASPNIRLREQRENHPFRGKPNYKHTATRHFPKI